MSFPRYPTYKDSGVEWLGEVPEHWDVKPLRYLANIRKGKLPSETFPISTCDTDLPYLSMEFLRGESETPNYVSDSPNLLCAESGDILILWDGSNAGEFLRAKYGAVSSTVALIEPKNIDKDFLAFSCKARERQLKDQTVGMGIPHVSGKELLSFAIPCPSSSEQTQIAAFLDRETAKIDALVAEQQRLMELLKEKRQAVISHAVTEGLNPDAPMKPSGIVWLGDVPTHWDVLTYRNVVTRVVVGIAEATTHAYAEEGVPIVRSTNIKTGEIDQSSMLYIKPEFAQKLESKALLAGDIVTTRTGANVGDSAVVPESLHMSQCFTLVISTPKPISNPHFYSHFINSIPGRLYIELTAWGSSQPNISVAIIQRMHTVAPPRDEQDEIVAYIERTSERFDELIAETQFAIDLLQERRTALISAAVTGQIDVRGLDAGAEALPEATCV